MGVPLVGPQFVIVAFRGHIHFCLAGFVVAFLFWEIIEITKKKQHNDVLYLKGYVVFF